MNTLKVVLLVAALSGLLMIIGYVTARQTGVMLIWRLSRMRMVKKQNPIQSRWGRYGRSPLCIAYHPAIHYSQNV